jgi:hypothetical protein
MSVTESAQFVLAPITGYEDEVRRIFRATLIVGKPMSANLINFDLYESMCLDWYLIHEPANAAVVLDENHCVLGYALVCLETETYERWLKAKAYKVARKNFIALLLGRMSKVDRQFYSRRFLDSFTVALSRSKADIHSEPHAHLNIVPGSRTGGTALTLLEHIDTVCRKSGSNSWVGEVNAMGNKRSKALVRVVGQVIDSKKNRTASHFAGTEVNRLTVRRTLA